MKVCSSLWDKRNSFRFSCVCLCYWWARLCRWDSSLMSNKNLHICLVLIKVIENTVFARSSILRVFVFFLARLLERMLFSATKAIFVQWKQFFQEWCTSWIQVLSKMQEAKEITFNFKLGSNNVKRGFGDGLFFLGEICIVKEWNGGSRSWWRSSCSEVCPRIEKRNRQRFFWSALNKVLSP